MAPPDDDPVEVFDGVAAQRLQNVVRLRLTAARPQVLVAYDDYGAAETDELVLLPGIAANAETTAALKSNYETFRRNRGGLYDRLRISAIICPLCGDRDPTTVDHVLPRDRWAEYSILPLNMIPACPDCNLAKSADVVDAEGEMLFIHPYRDALNDAQFLDVTVDTTHGVALVSYFIAEVAGFAPSLLARLRRHFAALGLNDHYRTKGAQEAEIRAHQVATLIAAGVGPDGIAQMLRSEAQAASEVLGQNHWRAVLNRRLAEHDHFIGGMT